MTTTTRYAACQPSAEPKACAAGTPMTVAMARPMPTNAMALPRPPGGAIDAADRLATEKYAPWGMPAMKRATMSTQ